MANFFSLTDSEGSERLQAISGGVQGRYDSMISDYQAQSERMMEDTLGGFKEEQALYKKKRGFRDPMAEFAAETGLRQQQAGQDAKLQQMGGLKGAAAFALGAQSLNARAQGFQMQASMKAQEHQRNTVALHDLMKTSGSIKAQMGMAQLQGVSSMRSQQIQSYAQMQSKAAELANQPSAFSRLLEAGIAAAGSAMGG